MEEPEKLFSFCFSFPGKESQKREIQEILEKILTNGIRETLATDDDFAAKYGKSIEAFVGKHGKIIITWF